MSKLDQVWHNQGDGDNGEQMAMCCWLSSYFSALSDYCHVRILSSGDKTFQFLKRSPKSRILYGISRIYNMWKWEGKKKLSQMKGNSWATVSHGFAMFDLW